jgi:hypothetical protein
MSITIKCDTECCENNEYGECKALWIYIIRNPIDGQECNEFHMREENE